MFKAIGENKTTVESVLSEAYNDLGVPKGVVIGFRISSQDKKLLENSEKLSKVSKYLLAASIVMDFVDAANTYSETNDEFIAAKKLFRNIVTTIAVYWAGKGGAALGSTIGQWAGSFIGTAVSPGAGTLIGESVGKVVGGVVGAFLAGWFTQKKLDEFFEKKGW